MMLTTMKLHKKSLSSLASSLLSSSSFSSSSSSFLSSSLSSSSSSKYGLETMTLIEQSTQDTTIERSIYNGCRSIITNDANSNSSSDSSSSSNNNVSSSLKVYELLVDLVNDDININDFYLGHKLHHLKANTTTTTNTDTTTSEWVDSINAINDILKPTKRGIDYISIPFNPNNNITNSINIINDINSNITIGIDINTDVILKTKNLISILDNDYNYNKLNNINLMTVSTNYMTAVIANDIITWANNKGIKTISTDVLSVFSQRPGIITVSKQVILPNGQCDEQQKAVDDLKRSMDTCMHAEKQFLSKLLSSSGLQPTSICFAHILLQTQNRILFPEEWIYIVNNQINPTLYNSIDILKKANKECHEWSLIYLPMVKYMIQSFRRFLEVRKGHVLNDICNDINSLSLEKKKISISELPLFIAHLTSLLNANQVMIPSNDIDINMSYDIKKKDDAYVIYNIIKNVLGKFSKNQ